MSISIEKYIHKWGAMAGEQQGKAAAANGVTRKRVFFERERGMEKE